MFCDSSTRVEDLHRPVDVAAMAPLADGVVVGSALIRDLDASASLTPAARAALTANFVADLRAATPAPRRTARRAAPRAAA